MSIVILAAGGSRRLGRPKQSVPFRGDTLLRHVIKTALAAESDGPVVVVLGADAGSIRETLADLPVEIVMNPEWEAGMGSSVRSGVAHVEMHHKPDAVLLMVCDQPMVNPQLLNDIIGRYRAGRGGIVASQYADVIGVPALFSRPYFDTLTSLPPTGGAQPILHANAADVVTVRFPDGHIDIDTDADLKNLA